MGAVLGLVFGVGLLLIWSAFGHPTAADGSHLTASAVAAQCRAG